MTCAAVANASGVMNCASASNINIRTANDTYIAAACLSSVTGNINVDGNTNGGSNTVLTAVLFPLLTYVGGYFQVWNIAGVGNTALTLIDAHSLAFVNGFLAFDNDPALASLDIPALTFVGQYFQIDGAAITSLNLPVLTFVGDFFYVIQNSNLASLAAPAMNKIANNGGLSGFIVSLCGNAAGFSYSADVTHAAAGKSCYLPPCATPSTCT